MVLLEQPSTAPYLTPTEHMKTNFRYWQSILREAERELEAATGRTTLNAAAQKLMRAKSELQRMQAEASRLTLRGLARTPTAGVA
jgi:hypothetical protein